MKQLHYLFSLSLILFCCNPKAGNNNNNEASSEVKATKKSEIVYDLSKPNKKYTLPNKLEEISGLSLGDASDELFCVNDERGKIFLYNLTKEEISKTIDFAKDGDYEGIEIVGEIAYIIRSDGKVISQNLLNGNTKNVDCSHADVAEYEGLSYDRNSNSLLLAAKEMKGEKKIFAYNLDDKTLLPKYIISQNSIDKNTDGKEFKPSGIAVHPQNSNIYILASAGKKLIILNTSGEKIKQYNLDNKLFIQPEGICFGANNELYIASEGKGGSGYILEFAPILQ